MSPELLLALAGFAFVSSATPGPNNLMLLASGASYGFRRSMPHMLGIGIGFTVLILAVGAGLAEVFLAFPMAQAALKGAAGLYMLWLAWKIATASAPGSATATGQPMTFFQAAAFQWVNPKAWAMALTAVTVYLPQPSALGVVTVALIFGAINLPTVSTWTLLGQAITRVLHRPSHRHAFNLTMAALLLASLWPMLR